MKGTRDKLVYELGTYFRFNFNTLGVATIEEKDFEVVTIEPKGDIIGLYIKFLFPASKKKIRVKQNNAKQLPPIIYNPRYFK